MDNVNIDPGEDGITGRDGYLITTALAYAIAVVPHLPEIYQASSDRDDMLALLRAKQPRYADTALKMAAETMSHLEEIYRPAEGSP